MPQLTQVNETQVKDESLSNIHIAPSAAIEYSKLTLTNGIVNNDINSSAAIAYSKLNLSGGIVDADISVSATINPLKIAGVSGTTGTGSLVFSANPTFTGYVTFGDQDANTVPYLDGSKRLVSSTVTPTQLEYLAIATGTTGTGDLVFSDGASLTITTLSSNASLYNMIDADNDSTSDVWAVRANGVASNIFSVDEEGNLYMIDNTIIDWNNGEYVLTHDGTALVTSGKLAIGENDAMTINGSATTSMLAVHTDDGMSTQNVELHRHSDNATGSIMYGAKSRGTGASPTIVNNGDTLLGVYAVGYDGTDYATSGALLFEVDGTPGNNDMPGRFKVQLAPDGSQTLATVLQVTNSGSVTLGSVAGTGTGNIYASRYYKSNANNYLDLDVSGNASLYSRGSVFAEIDSDNSSTATAIFGVRADLTTIVFQVREDGLITATSAITGLTNITASGNATIGTNDTNTHIFRGAFSMAYGAGSTTRMRMTNTGLLMLGASTTPVAGVQLESGNAGSGTPSDYVLVKSSGSVANRGGLLISNQASVSGTTNSLKITGTFNSSTSGVASVGWVDNNATETWVGGVPSMIFAYSAGAPFTRFNQTVQMLAGQTIQSSASTTNYINIDSSGNSIYATRSTARIQIDEDNNTTATAFFQVFADAGTVNLFQIREDGQTQFQYNTTTSNAVTITGSTLTTGSSLRIYDNSSSASTRSLQTIINDNTSATGVTMISFQQDAVTSTNFKRYIALDGIVIWTSHTGTDPNGALSGNAGDMCLSTNGNIYRCTGTTNWSAM